MSAKVYHIAGKIRADGAVSARCFTRPRAIDLSRESWTFLPEQVTCPACKALCWACHGSGFGPEAPATGTCNRCGGTGREPAHCRCGSTTHSACGKAKVDLGALDTDHERLPPGTPVDATPKPAGRP